MRDVWLNMILPLLHSSSFVVLINVNRFFRRLFNDLRHETKLKIEAEGVSEKQRTNLYLQKHGTLTHIIISGMGGWPNHIRGLIESGSPELIIWARANGLFPRDICNEVDIMYPLAFGIERVDPHPVDAYLRFLRIVFNVEHLSQVPGTVLVILTQVSWVLDRKFLPVLRELTPWLHASIASCPRKSVPFVTKSHMNYLTTEYTPRMSPRFYHHSERRLWSVDDEDDLWIHAFASGHAPMLQWICDDLLKMSSVPKKPRLLRELASRNTREDVECVLSLVTPPLTEHENLLYICKQVIEQGNRDMLSYCLDAMGTRRLTEYAIDIASQDRCFGARDTIGWLLENKHYDEEEAMLNLKTLDDEMREELEAFIAAHRAMIACQ